MNFYSNKYRGLILLWLGCATLVIACAPASAAHTQYDISQYGALADGKTVNTKAIQTAIDQCAAAGGGTLVIPKGEFVSGSLFLKPGVNVELRDGAVLECSANPQDFEVRKGERFEGHFEEWTTGLLNAEHTDHLRITGPGTLYGNGAAYWKNNSPFGRPRLCAIRDSRDVIISGVHFLSSPSWNLHLYNCKNVIVENNRFEILDKEKGPSTDGTDVDSSQNVTIRGCFYSVNDDCVCIKGNRYDGLNQEPASIPSSYVRITGCTFKRGMGALSLGTEATQIRDIEMDHCTVMGNMPMFRLKMRPDTAGQDYQYIRVRDIKLDGRGKILSFELTHGTKTAPKPPRAKIKYIEISNITGMFGSFGTIANNPNTDISYISLKNINVKVTGNPQLNTNGVTRLRLKNITVTSRVTSTNVPTAKSSTIPAPVAGTAIFNNGAVTNYIKWLDTDGNLINAHDGGILYAGGEYHWYGMALRSLPSTNGADGGQKTTTGVVMYASTNLIDWTYEGIILPCSTNPANPLYGPMRFERPKIIYNDATKKYVMWFHYVGFPGDHGTRIGSGDAGVASCDTVNGQYTFRSYSRPLGPDGIVRDCTLFKDDDGSAYFIYDRDVRVAGPGFGRVLHVVKLTDDYLDCTSSFYEITNASRREAPVMLKHNGSYFLITSAESGWKFNQANYYRATNIFGPYTEMGDPCIGQDTATTFNSQGTQAFSAEGRQDAFIFIAERHNTAMMTDSSYIFLPVNFPTASTLQLQYLPTWGLNYWSNNRIPTI